MGEGATELAYENMFMSEWLLFYAALSNIYLYNAGHLLVPVNLW